MELLKERIRRDRVVKKRKCIESRQLFKSSDGYSVVQ